LDRIFQKSSNKQKFEGAAAPTLPPQCHWLLGTIKDVQKHIETTNIQQEI